jgi:predicted DNA-binding transcriptional regulator AlpA
VTFVKKQTRKPPAGKQVTAARQTTGVTPLMYGRREIVAVTSLSYPTLWAMACRGEFPRGRVVGGKTMWIAAEVDNWLISLPVRPLKGDTPAPQNPRAEIAG